MTVVRAVAVILCGLACGVKAPPRPPALVTSPTASAGEPASDAGPTPRAGADAGFP